MGGIVWVSVLSEFGEKLEELLDSKIGSLFVKQLILESQKASVSIRQIGELVHPAVLKVLIV